MTSTQEEIIAMAKQAGAYEMRENCLGVYPWACEFEIDQLQRFATLVAAAEREACAQACKAIGENYPVDVFPPDGKSIDCISASAARLTATNCEKAIGARSKP